MTYMRSWAAITSELWIDECTLFHFSGRKDIHPCSGAKLNHKQEVGRRGVSSCLLALLSWYFGLALFALSICSGLAIGWGALTFLQLSKGTTLVVCLFVTPVATRATRINGWSAPLSRCCQESRNPEKIYSPRRISDPMISLLSCSVGQMKACPLKIAHKKTCSDKITRQYLLGHNLAGSVMESRGGIGRN